jgi:NitT/TauT family transport system substrate-binding protein
MQYGYAQIKARGIVDSGDTKTLGIYAMTNARWAGFFKQMAATGMYPADMDYQSAYTLQFVDHGRPK